MQDLTDIKIFLASLLQPIVYDAVKAATGQPLPILSLAGQDELLTPEEAARFLKISKVTLWSWEKKGIVRGRHIGNLKRFSRNDILAIGTTKGGVEK